MPCLDKGRLGEEREEGQGSRKISRPPDQREQHGEKLQNTEGTIIFKKAGSSWVTDKGRMDGSYKESRWGNDGSTAIPSTPRSGGNMGEEG